MNSRVWLGVGLVVLGAVSAARAKLDIGDPAPELNVTEWVKGQPVDLAQAKGSRIVVVDFWATWCGPCVVGIPHMTELQRELGPKGVTIIGMTEHDPDNTREKVKEFVQQQGDKLGYTIAFEQGDKTWKAYMDAAEEMGIPTAFVIDKQGVIAWIGHPASGLDDVLKELLEGTYDLKVAKKAREVERLMWEAVYASESDKALGFADQLIELKPQLASPWELKILLYLKEKEQPENALKTARQALEQLHDSAEALASLADALLGAREQAGFAELAEQASRRAVELAPDTLDTRLVHFGALVALKRFEDAEKWIRTTMKLAPQGAKGLARTAEVLSSEAHVGRYGELAFEAVRAALALEPDEPRHHWLHFQIAVATKMDLKLAEPLALTAVNRAADTAGLLNEIAWVLLTEESFAGNFKQVARAAAERCHAVSGGKNWMYLDTLALAKFETGAVDEAIALQKKAIELCPDEVVRLDLRATLQRYEQAKG